jgi:predicted NodU family carbamoyl transferase
MYILGINDTHDASACLIKDGKLLVAIAEERLTRKKNISNLPEKAIARILKSQNIESFQLDLVAVATKEAHYLNLLNIPAQFTVEDWRKFHEEYYVPIIYKNKKIKIKDVFPNYKPQLLSGYPIKKLPFISNLECSKKDHLVILLLTKLKENHCGTN